VAVLKLGSALMVDIRGGCVEIGVAVLAAGDQLCIIMNNKTTGS
jgi:hypothetical protein